MFADQEGVSRPKADPRKLALRSFAPELFVCIGFGIECPNHLAALPIHLWKERLTVRAGFCIFTRRTARSESPFDRSFEFMDTAKSGRLFRSSFFGYVAAGIKSRFAFS